ncbi:Outer membrane protein assembly factor YaeT precursor [Hyalangium minutum]|uniref:Outer membrane protein assembly factor YaeT n=2 Tax=Hyalangium minutum TaxID=394096 RepID=A0A085W7E0_9BACT|nr:outer membrane protein assembly factor [Hyalangium minutum]KFE63603.1 Outer membrane protein assembly factor YaeT precursor [Hyalangium minutum]
MCLLWAGLALAGMAPQEPPSAAEARAEPQEQEPQEVKEVELRLPPGSDTRGLADLVTIRRGQVLSTLAVRRSVEALWNTGRFTNVEARTVDVRGGVRLVFQLTPVQQLVRLVIEGNVALSDDEIREASGLPEYAPLDPDSVDRARAAVEQAYHRKGYDQAYLRVSEEPSPGGVVLVFTMDEGQPTRVGRVTLTGSPGLPLSSLLEALGLEPGVVLDQARVDAGLEKLRTVLRQQRYYRARVGAPTVTLEQGLATVALPVSAGPRYTLHFHGNHQFPGVVLERVLAYDGTEVLDPGVVWTLARRLEVFYRYRGFNDVRVTPREVRRPDHAEAVLAFEIEEGRPLTVTEVRFRGNRALPSGVLREVLAEIIRTRDPVPELTLPLRDDPLEVDGRSGQGPRSVPLAPDPHRVFVEEAYLGAAEVLTEAYRERGFPQAQVHFSRLDVDVSARTAVAEFEVEEGSEVRVDEVVVDGLPQGTGTESVGLASGDSLSEEAVERARQNLEQEVARQGYLFARVEVKTEPNTEDPRYVKVFLRVEPGPQVRVGRIIFQGLTRSDERTVRALLALEVGKPLDLEKLAEGRRRLARLNIFRQVEVQLREPNRREEIKDILVTVQERPRIDGEVSGGYFLVDGPRVTLDTAFPNVDGRGLNLLARAKVNYVGWSQEAFSGRYGGVQDDSIRGWEGLGGRGNVALTQPRLNFFLLPRDTGARVDLIGERVHRPSYLSTRFAAVGGLDWPAARWLSLGIQGELEHNRLRSRSGVLNVLSRADQERLRFPYGIFTLYSLRGTSTLDFRDEPTNPRKGLLVSGSAEFTRDLSVAPTDALGNRVADFPIHELKLSGSVSVYAPLGRRASLALSARAGTIVPLSPNAQSIGSKLFYLGGSSSLRGFREDGLLPEDQRAEVRRQLLDCRAVITPQGCPAELVAVLAGQAPLSQGGELFTLGKAELRLPAFRSLDLGFFLEAGNLWGDRTNFDPTILRYTAGVGLRYVTPVGPLAFDLGFNLDPDEDFNEPASQFHFSIGVF